MATNLVADDQELAGKLLYSRPYYRTGYMLVERKNGPHARSLQELKGREVETLGHGSRLGGGLHASASAAISVGSIAINWRRSKPLNDSDIDHAYLWANVGWTLHTTPEWSLQIAPNYVPEDHWDIAIAMDRSDDELKRQVDAALDSMIKDGTVAGSLARYHMPYHVPTAEPANGDRRPTGETIKHRVADRGPRASDAKSPSVQE